VAGSGARGDGRKGHLVQAPHACAEVEIPDVDLIGARVDAEDVIRVEVGEDLMRVRSLAVRVGSGAVPLALEVEDLGADRPIGRDRMDRIVDMAIRAPFKAV
jgi:hypothetical protein